MVGKDPETGGDPENGLAFDLLSSVAENVVIGHFAETWAHYLHICDTVETASDYGLTAVAPLTVFSSFRDVLTGIWVPLSIALNMINRSMGKEDLYPFVIPAPVIDKLDFVASLATVR